MPENYQSFDRRLVLHVCFRLWKTPKNSSNAQVSNIKKIKIPKFLIFLICNEKDIINHV